MLLAPQHRPLGPRQRVARQHPWPLDYDTPGPRGRAEACLHLLSAGLCPGFTVAELRDAWDEASEDEREAIITTVKAVAA